MKIRRDEWLASMLGTDAWQVDPGESTAPDQIHAGLANPQEKPGFYFAKIPTTQVPILNAFITTGFRVVDVNVTFERSASVTQSVSEARRSRGGSSTDPTIHIREAKPPTDQAIVDIAETCFTYSRFHLDPQIPRSVADRIKREWVANCLNGQRGSGVLIAECDGAAAGFLTRLERTESQHKVRIIDLIGVAPAFQGRGIGRSLVRHFLESDSSSESVFRVGTQVANIPSLRLYESMGFRINATQYVLHAHF